jgi:hypothetical protein
VVIVFQSEAQIAFTDPSADLTKLTRRLNPLVTAVTIVFQIPLILAVIVFHALPQRVDSLFKKPDQIPSKAPKLPVNIAIIVCTTELKKETIVPKIATTTELIVVNTLITAVTPLISVENAAINRLMPTTKTVPIIAPSVVKIGGKTMPKKLKI